MRLCVRAVRAQRRPVNVSVRFEMIFAIYDCVPGPKHPDLNRIGSASVCCWLRVRSFAEAKALAEKAIQAQHWKILSLNEMWRIPRGHYRAGDSGFAYYEQARTDRAVYFFHQSPKYPVYCVDFSAISTQTNTRYPKGTYADVKYLVVNERVSSSSDFFDDFWDKDNHKRKAITLGRKRIQAEKWRVTSVQGGRPVNYLSFPEDPLLTQYYEEAEEYGDCLAFWTDQEPNKTDARDGL
jgi:hypothetical protein